MRDSKIVYAIDKLSRVERNRFQRYLDSPYFNTDPNLAKLYTVIGEQLPAILDDQLDKQDLWKLVREDTPYNDTRFRKYTSDLLKHLEGFLYQEYTRQDKGHEYTFILDALNERRMEKLYNSAVRSGRDFITRRTQRDSQHFQRLYAMEKRFYDLSEEKVHRGVAAPTTDIVDALDIFYVIEKLRLYCSMQVRSFYVKSEYEFRLIQEIINLVEQNDLLDIPAVEIYYRWSLTYSRPDDQENYERLKHLVTSNHDLFSADELHDIYQGVLNYHARGVNRGLSGSNDEFIAICDIIYQRKVFSAQGELNPWIFRNSIVAALRVNRFDWVEHTLTHYAQFLPADLRENAVNFNYAQLYFYKKEYGTVLDYLQKVAYDDPAYLLNSRGLLVAVHYELGQLEPLYSSINAFRTFLKRQPEMTERVKAAYRGLLKVTQRLARTQYGDDTRIKGIEKYLEENPTTVSMQWLQTKLQELRTNKRGW